MKKFILIIASFSSILVSVYASDVFSLTKAQQNRLNVFIKQVKMPIGDYKLSVTSSGGSLEAYTSSSPEVQVVEKEKIVTETKTIEVPKEVIVEKVLPDPRVDTLKLQINDLQSQVDSLKSQLEEAQNQANIYHNCIQGKWNRSCGY